MKPVIHLVKTRLVNSYIVEYPDRLLVVDVAVKCHRYVLGFIEEELNRSIQDIALVICTHDDPDHIGGIHALAELCSAQVAIPYASNSLWRKTLHDPYGALNRFSTSFREIFRARAWEMYFNPFRNRDAKTKSKYQGAAQNITPSSTSSDKDTEYKKLKADFRLKDQQKVPGFEDWAVIHTPGHSWDSCCFYHEQSDSLISGDTLLGSGKNNQLVVPAIYSNRRHIKRTLLKLKALNIKVVYPGHGSTISGSSLIENTKFQ